MGQSNSKKRKKLSKHVTNTISDTRESQVLELYSSNSKRNELNHEDITSNEEFSFSLHGDGNKQEKLRLKTLNSNEAVSKDYKCKYELIKAVSTSAKLHSKNGIKKNCNLSIQTFRGDAVQYLLDISDSKNFSSQHLKEEESSKDCKKEINCQIEINSLFTAKNEPIISTASKECENCRELPSNDVNSSKKTNFRKFIETSSSVSKKELAKKLANVSICSFCGYYLEPDDILDSTIEPTEEVNLTKKEPDKLEKIFFYRCPVCRHLIESKSKNKKKCTNAKPQKLPSIVLDDNEFTYTNSSSYGFTPTQLNDSVNLTECVQSIKEFYRNENAEKIVTSSKSFTDELTKTFEDKSIMCNLRYNKEDAVSHDVKLLSSSSVLLLPSQSYQNLQKMKWESILPKLVNMPTNKVLYVVEVCRSKQKSQNKSSKKLTDMDKLLDSTEISCLHSTKNKPAQISTNSNNKNSKNKDNGDASCKILTTLEKRYNVKLKTLNDFLLQQPKYLISLLIKGTLPRQKPNYKPVKIPLDYQKFTTFLSSGL